MDFAILSLVIKVATVLFPKEKEQLAAGEQLVKTAAQYVPKQKDRLALSHMLENSAADALEHVNTLLQQEALVSEKVSKDFLTTVLADMVDNAELDLDKILDEALDKHYVAQQLLSAIPDSELEHASLDEQEAILRLIEIMATALVAAILDATEFVALASKRTLAHDKALADELRQMGKSVDTLFARTTALSASLDDLLKTLLKGQTPTTANYEAAYLETFYERYSRISILGVDFASSLYFPVEDVHVELNAAQATDMAATQSATEFIANKDFSCILGNAGGGKTTLLQWLAYDLIKHQRIGAQRLKTPVPFLIRLRDFVSVGLPDRSSFFQFGATPGLAPPEHFVEKVFAERRAVILIDGVDELDDQTYSTFCQWLSDNVFNDPGPRKVIMTSRPGTRIVEVISRFDLSSATIVDMTPAQIGQLCNRWFSAAHINDPSADLSFCKEAPLTILNLRKKRRNIRDLTRTPLFCSMLCALYYHRKGHLPESATDLYKSVIALLIDRRDAQRHILAGQVSVSYDAKFAVLKHLSYHLSKSGRLIFEADEFSDVCRHVLPRYSRIDHSDSEESVLHLLRFFTRRASIFEVCGIDKYVFRHKSFMEFCAAAYIADSAEDDVLLEHLGSESYRAAAFFFVNLVAEERASRFISRVVTGKSVNGTLDALGKIAFSLGLVLSAEALDPEIRINLGEQVRAVVPPKSDAAEQLLENLPEDLHGIVCDQILNSWRSGDLNSISTVRCLARLGSIEGREGIEQVISAQISNGVVSACLGTAWLFMVPELIGPLIEKYQDTVELELSCNEDQFAYLSLRQWRFIRSLTLSFPISSQELIHSGLLRSLKNICIADALLLDDFEWLGEFPMLKKLICLKCECLGSLSGLESSRLEEMELDRLPQSMRREVISLEESSGISFTVNYGPVRPQQRSVSGTDSLGLLAIFPSFSDDDIEFWLDDSGVTRRRMRSAIRRAHAIELESHQEGVKSVKSIRNDQSRNFRGRKSRKGR